MREVLYYWNQKKNGSWLDYSRDSVWNTPNRSGFKDNSEWFSSASKAQKANYLWNLINSTSEKPPILKKYRSDTTSQKKRSEVRFKEFPKEDSDSDNIIVAPQRLNFDDADNTCWLFESGRKRYAMNNRDGTYRLMENLEHSIEKENKSFWNLFRPRKKDSHQYYDQYWVPNRAMRDPQTKVLDIRTVGLNHDENNKDYAKHNYSMFSNKNASTHTKENMGEFDLIDDWRAFPSKFKME
jgi:hypothetical protein